MCVIRRLNFYEKFIIVTIANFKSSTKNDLVIKQAILIVWIMLLMACNGGGGADNPSSDQTIPLTISCTYVNWIQGVNYPIGAIVKYVPNGFFYKALQAGANGSNGTNPTISSFYWGPTECFTAPQGTSKAFIVTEVQFNQMFPPANRHPLYTYAGLVSAMRYYPGFSTTGTDTVRKQEAAAFLANVAHESDFLEVAKEYDTSKYPLYCSAGVGKCGGKEYYGRGPIQLSWDYNYAEAGQAIGIDLLNYPELVATDPAITWRTALWYWMTGTGSAGTTSHKAMINSSGFGITIKAIDGDLECGATVGTLPYEQMQDRVKNYTRFTTIIGVPTGGGLTC